MKYLSKALMIIIPLALLFSIFLMQESCTTQKKTPIVTIDSSKLENNAALVDTEYYAIVEKPAIFQKPDMNVFCLYLKKITNYPYAALKKKQQGYVLIQFGVSCYGETKYFSTLKGSGYKLLDDEAVRALKTLPKWEPAKIGNKSVGQIFIIQVKFDAKLHTVTVTVKQ